MYKVSKFSVFSLYFDTTCDADLKLVCMSL